MFSGGQAEGGRNFTLHFGFPVPIVVPASKYLSVFVNLISFRGATRFSNSTLLLLYHHRKKAAFVFVFKKGKVVSLSNQRLKFHYEYLFQIFEFTTLKYFFFTLFRTQI
jgi:hypothetical protein